MFVECEKVFLSAKNLIIDHRNRLKEDIIQACTFLRHWFKEAGFRKPAIAAGDHFLHRARWIDKGFNTSSNRSIQIRSIYIYLAMLNPVQFEALN